MDKITDFSSCVADTKAIEKILNKLKNTKEDEMTIETKAAVECLKEWGFL